MASSRAYLVMCPLRGDGVVLIPVLLHPKQCLGIWGQLGRSWGQGGTCPWSRAESPGAEGLWAGRLGCIPVKYGLTRP